MWCPLRMVAVLHHRDGLAERRPDVVVVDARGHHAHDHLESARLGDFDLLDLEGVLRLSEALLPDHPGGHALRELAWLRVDLGDLLQVDCHGAQLPRCSGVGCARHPTPGARAGCPGWRMRAAAGLARQAGGEVPSAAAGRGGQRLVGGVGRRAREICWMAW